MRPLFWPHSIGARRPFPLAIFLTMAAAASLVPARDSRADPPAHTGDMYLENGTIGLHLQGPNAELFTTAYYASIEVYDANGTTTTTAKRGSFDKWKSLNGFDKDPNSEYRVIYHNYYQLEFARDMHCRRVNNGITTIACYVRNYAGNYDKGKKKYDDPKIALDRAKHPKNNIPDSIFAMELLVASPDAPHRVIFIAYDPHNNGAPMRAVNFDKDGPKNVPMVCMGCHGGNFNQTKGLYPPQIMALPDAIPANFLPFDSPSFKYAPGETDVPLRNAFRQLNHLVRDTHLAFGQDDPAPLIKDLINEWYKWCPNGVGTTTPPGSCYIRSGPTLYFPTGTCTSTTESCGWSGYEPDSTATLKVDRKSFYRSVVGVYCRTCHLTNVGFASWFENYSVFKNNAATISENVAGNKMPDSQPGYTHYWEDVNAQNLMKKLLKILLP